MMASYRPFPHLEKRIVQLALLGTMVRKRRQSLGWLPDGLPVKAQDIVRA